MRTLIVSGFLAKNAEIDTLPSGNRVLKLALASSEYGDEKNPDGTNKTVWVNVSSFKEDALRMAQYLKKGNNIIAIGDMKTRVYQNKSQEWVSSIELHNADIKFNGNGTKKDEISTMENTPSAAPKETVRHADMDIPVQTAPDLTNVDAVVDDLPF